MRVRSGLPLGVNAAFFEEARRVRALEGRLAERVMREDFNEVLLPILDYYEPYKNLLGEGFERSRQSEQLYRFVDRDGQLLALRYDFTPMLARLVAPRVGGWEMPARLFYRGDVVRFEEPAAGRLRESAQFGAEILDRSGVGHELEVLDLFVELLSSALAVPAGSAPGVQIVLGVANALEGLLEQTGDSDRAAQAVALRDRQACRSFGAELLEVVSAGVPSELGELGEAAGAVAEVLRLAAGLAERCAATAAPGRPRVDVAVDLAEFVDFGRRGQHGEHPYYDGLVFRAYTAGAAQPVGNGGRYDGLFETLGADISAAGFTLGIDQLLAAAESATEEGGQR